MRCPCESGLLYEKCCLLLHKGEKKALSAEAVMRARYSAFVTGELSYIKATHHPEYLNAYDEEGTKNWAKDAKWLGLKILNCVRGTESDSVGEVEFVAKYSVNGQDISHHEMAQFSKVGDSWFFKDGKIIKDSYRREAPKVGRNDPCSCGSGKKYKKCCGN